MIKGYAIEDGHLRASADPIADFDRIVWLDLLDPSEAEKAQAEEALQIDLPTREEMQEIEISSRLYRENGAAFMTAVLLAQAEADAPTMGPVTFVLAGRRLVTLRHIDPKPFQSFPGRGSKAAVELRDGEMVSIALFDAVIDRLADILERVGAETNGLSAEIFARRGTKPTRPEDFRRILREIGRKGELVSDVRESLASLQRVFGFLAHGLSEADDERRTRVKSLSRDAASLVDFASFLAQSITFLLDATLGMIGIEQNAIIKIFSVAAVIFLPPTLIASIYGMNFEHMPELDWLLGYPFALVLMVISAILPFLYFKRRGWL